MGATRALITHCWESGAVTYINGKDEAAKFLRLMADAAGRASPVSERVAAVDAGLRAQHALGTPSLASFIKELRHLNRQANLAKHDWPEFGTERDPEGDLSDSVPATDSDIFFPDAQYYDLAAADVVAASSAAAAGAEAFDTIDCVEAREVQNSAAVAAANATVAVAYDTIGFVKDSAAVAAASATAAEASDTIDLVEAKVHVHSKASALTVEACDTIDCVKAKIQDCSVQPSFLSAASLDCEACDAIDNVKAKIQDCSVLPAFLSAASLDCEACDAIDNVKAKIQDCSVLPSVLSAAPSECVACDAFDSVKDKIKDVSTLPSVTPAAALDVDACDTIDNDKVMIQNCYDLPSVLAAALGAEACDTIDNDKVISHGRSSSSGISDEVLLSAFGAMPFTDCLDILVQSAGRPSKQAARHFFSLYAQFLGAQSNGQLRVLARSYGKPHKAPRGKLIHFIIEEVMVIFIDFMKS